MLTLYGKNSVHERLRVNPKTIKRVFLQDNFKDPRILKAIKSAGVSVKTVSKKELTRIKRADNLQGIVAQVEPFEYAVFDDLIYRPEQEKLSLIFLDRIYDPQNLGAIIRVAACFGNFAVIIPKHKACQINETVLRVACGGENYVPVAMISNVPSMLIEAKKRGYWVVGAVVEGGKDINSVSLPFPLCLVLGSEGKGVRYGIEKQIDLSVSISMRGAPISFNVTSASVVFCYEIAKQRNK
jgi:23S rRNA (guanosine2251-2'-O)-methyltransferase